MAKLTVKVTMKALDLADEFVPEIDRADWKEMNRRERKEAVLEALQERLEVLLGVEAIDEWESANDDYMIDAVKVKFSGTPARNEYTVPTGLKRSRLIVGRVLRVAA